jgi:F-type H+-transporting ATPase subunit b
MDFFYQPASWVFIAFIIFISIAIYLKVPNMVTKLLDEQISKIKNDLDDARKLKEDANSLLAEYERKIESANKEAENIINQAKNNAKSYEENSNKKVEEFILRSEKQSIEKIQQAQKSAIKKINEEIVNKSVEVAEKIISKNMNDQNNNKLFENSINQIKKLQD